MNVLPREKQIEVIAALCEGVGIRTAARLTGVNRGTVGNLALRVGLGCMELHDRLMVGIRTERLELDEAWSFVGKKQKNVKRHEIHAKGDQYIFIGMAGTQKAIISWGVGKRNGESTMDFLHDLRSRVIGQPEISRLRRRRVAWRDRKDLLGNASGKGSAGPVLARCCSKSRARSSDWRSRSVRLDQLR
jgi:hypothetical protein